MFWIGLLVGLFFGSIVGIMTVCLLKAGDVE